MKPSIALSADHLQNPESLYASCWASYKTCWSSKATCRGSGTKRSLGTTSSCLWPQDWWQITFFVSCLVLHVSHCPYLIVVIVLNSNGTRCVHFFAIHRHCLHVDWCLTIYAWNSDSSLRSMSLVCCQTSHLWHFIKRKNGRLHGIADMTLTWLQDALNVLQYNQRCFELDPVHRGDCLFSEWRYGIGLTLCCTLAGKCRECAAKVSERSFSHGLTGHASKLTCTHRQMQNMSCRFQSLALVTSA